MDKYLSEIEEKVSVIRDELETLALNIHKNPELGMEEYQACKWQTELMRKHGFTVEECFCEMQTVFDAVYKNFIHKKLRGRNHGPLIFYVD